MKLNNIDLFLKKLLKKQSENYHGNERDNIDFDGISAYIENRLPLEEFAGIEKMIIENDELAEIVNETRKFLEEYNDNQNEVTIIPMKKSRNWPSELFRYAAAIIVVATAVTFVFVIINPSHDGIPKQKSAVYSPKTTRSINQPASIPPSSAQKTNELTRLK